MYRELISCRFDWDEQKRELKIDMKDGRSITLNKVQIYSLVRFIIRISSWAFLRRKE